MTKTLAAFLIVFTSFPMATVALAEERLVPNEGQAPIVLAQNAPGFWNGYHGEQRPRDGFRRGPDGWWYPLGAFAAG